MPTNNSATTEEVKSLRETIERQTRLQNSAWAIDTLRSGLVVNNKESTVEPMVVEILLAFRADTSHLVHIPQGGDDDTLEGLVHMIHTLTGTRPRVALVGNNLYRIYEK